MTHCDTLCNAQNRIVMLQQMDDLHGGLLRDSPRQGGQSLHSEAP